MQEKFNLINRVPKLSISPAAGVNFARTGENQGDRMLSYKGRYSRLSLHGDCLTGYNEFLSVAGRWPHAAHLHPLRQAMACCWSRNFIPTNTEGL